MENSLHKLAYLENVVIIAAMSYFRLITFFLLLCTQPLWAAPQAQYKVGSSKKWQSVKSTGQAKKSSKTTNTSSKTSSGASSKKSYTPKYRLLLPPKPLEMYYTEDYSILLNQIPSFGQETAGKISGTTVRDDVVSYTLDPELQAVASKLISNARSPHIAAVVMQPSTGRILAIAEKSSSYQDLSIHSAFPAASLFKVITAAAAVEKAGLQPLTQIQFRGGDYMLSPSNYRPDLRKDGRRMTAAEALGRSCNPVFGRIGLEYLNPATLRYYAKLFAFNERIPFEAALPASSAVIPEDDYELSRTSAGFGAVTISPVHAALIMSAIANQGLMPRPILVEKAVSADGKLIYQSRPTLLKRTVHPETASTLLDMMEYTTTVGTSRRQFAQNKQNRLRGIRVAAKTGTLRGEDPKGLNHLFIAAAPIERPRVVVAIIAVDGGTLDSKPSYLGRLLMEKYLLG